MFIIKKSKIPQWGYEITEKGTKFHNIASSIDAAIDYLKSRYGHDVQYKIK